MLSQSCIDAKHNEKNEAENGQPHRSDPLTFLLSVLLGKVVKVAADADATGSTNGIDRFAEHTIRQF